MRRIVVASAILAIAPLSAIGVFLTSTSWWEALFLALTLLFATTLLREWKLDGYTPRAVFLFVFTAAAYLYGALMANSPISFMPVALVGALLVVKVKKRRVAAVACLAAGVTAMGAASLLTNPATVALVIQFVVVPAVGTLYITAVVFIGELAWALVREAERAGEVEAALAISEERARFAGDLHDIQGQSLHVIKLKAALAQRLVERAPTRAADELAEIRRLVDETVAQTRALTYARYDIDLASELENTRRLAEASGMEVIIRTDPDRPELDRSVPGSTVDSGASAPHPLLAHALREATTNLLRHADPTWVRITASTVGVEISNDGVTGDREVHPRGLARLSHRISTAGGQLSYAKHDGVFTVSARMPPGTTTAPETTAEEPA